jgi:thiamine biosynthesis protein ThiS
MPNEERLSIFRNMTQTTVLGDAVTVNVNGANHRLRAGSTLGDLLRSLELDPRMVVIEYNRTILRDRSAYDTLTLAADDTLEIVHFVGGG